MTAAVLRVILSLALLFGAAVILPDRFEGGINWFAAAMSIAAFIALYRLKVAVLWVVSAGGLTGLERAPLFG